MATGDATRKSGGRLLHNGIVLPVAWPPNYGVSSETDDFEGKALSHFSEGNWRPLRVDSTLAHVAWRGSSDLSDLAGEVLRFLFILRDGRLHSFWVSPDESGASNGYVAAGWPGFTGPTDTVGKSAMAQANVWLS
jgi:hypothetical protein